MGAPVSPLRISISFRAAPAPWLATPSDLNTASLALHRPAKELWELGACRQYAILLIKTYLILCRQHPQHRRPIRVMGTRLRGVPTNPVVGLHLEPHLHIPTPFEDPLPAESTYNRDYDEPSETEASGPGSSTTMQPSSLEPRGKLTDEPSKPGRCARTPPALRGL